MTPLCLDGWDIRRMVTGHYQGQTSDHKTNLCKFIRTFLDEFHSLAEFKATLITPAKIQVFHGYVEGRFKDKYGQDFDEFNADAWFLAFLCFWYRNRTFVEDLAEQQQIVRKGFFYQTMINEWDSQRSKGASNDSILLYTITHPRLSQNPYFTIPIRIEHIRRIRVYWNKDPKILDDCRSHLYICESELELLEDKRELTCSAIPGTPHWLKNHVKLQQQLCDLREVSKSQFRRERLTEFSKERRNYPTDKQTDEHQEIYAQVMELWELINHHRLSGFHFEDDLDRRRKDVEKFIKNVEEKGKDSLSEYLQEVWRGQRPSVDIMAKDVALGNRNPTPEYYLQVYFKAIMSVFEARLDEEKNNSTKPTSSELNHSLRDSIFPLPNSTYPVKTPDLGKKVRSAVKIHLIEKDGKMVEDKTKSSLINDCRDSAKLALFLLEKIQLRSGRHRNYHLSFVLWDFMFRLWTFLGTPSFTDSSRHIKDEGIQKYISSNDKKLANEIQELIDCVFTRARFVAHPHDHREERAGKLVPIIDKWKEYIEKTLGNEYYSTNLGEIQARCGHLIGMMDEHDQRIDREDLKLRKNNLILFKPSEAGNMWEKGLVFGEQYDDEEGILPIFVPTSSEISGRRGGIGLHGF